MYSIVNYKVTDVKNLTASARTFPQTLLRLTDMLVIQWIAKENKIMVHRIYHNKLANDKTRIWSSRFPCDEQKRSTANENRNEIDVRSMFTNQSYVRIDRFGINYQSNQFMQSFKFFILLYRSIHSTKIRNRKPDEIHKRAQSVWCVFFIHLFNLFIYLINAIISYFLIVPIGMSLGVLNFTLVVKQSQKNKM